MITNFKLYEDTEPVEGEYRDTNHRYKIDGGFKVGVSTITKTLPKDLMGWAAYEAVNAFKESVSPYVTSEAKTTKLTLKKMADEAKKAHQKKSQRGMDVGSIVHAWIKEEVDAKGIVEVPQYVLDLEDKANEEESKIINENLKTAEWCISEWRRWCKEEDVEFIHTEKIVYSKKLDYCGTLDVIFKSRRTGKIYLGDYKTSEPEKIKNNKYQVIGHKAYPEHFAQCAGYDYAFHEETELNPDGYAVIYLPKTSEYQMFTREETETDRKGWQHLVHVYRWLDLMKKTKS